MFETRTLTHIHTPRIYTYCIRFRWTANILEIENIKQMETRNFSEISDEILVEVFTWVPPLDLLINVYPVCLRFHETLDDDAFWSQLAANLKKDTTTTTTECSTKKEKGEEAGNSIRNDGDAVTTTSTDKSVVVRDCCSTTSSIDINWPSSDELTKHQCQRLCIFLTSYKHQDEQPPKIPKCLELGNILVSKERASILRTQSRGYLRTCFASTTDNRNELIENVLTESRHTNTLANDWNAVINKSRMAIVFSEIRGECTWWSSRATNTQEESDELVAFCTEYNTSVMIEVAIKPLRDPFLRQPVYTWKRTTIRAYLLGPDKIFHGGNYNTNGRGLGGYAIHSDAEDEIPCVMQGKPDGPWGDWASDEDTIQSLLENETPVYVSSQLVGPKNDEWIRYKLPGAVIANVVTITLGGKDNRQYQATGYYACIERLFVRGIPLYESEHLQRFSSDDLDL